MRTYLSEHKNAGKFVIDNICTKSGLYSRLIGQGLYNGKEFEIISFTQGKYVLKVDNSKLTLDKSMAKHVAVRKCGKTCFWSKLTSKFNRNKSCNTNCIEEAKLNENSEIIGNKLEIPVEASKKMIG